MRLPPCPLTAQAQHFCHRRPAALQCSKGVALKPPTATALQRGVELQYSCSKAASIKIAVSTSIFGTNKQETRMQVSTPSVRIVSHGPNRNSIGRCIFKEKLFTPSCSDFLDRPRGTHSPGFEKLPAVALTFGFIAANFVQERWIRNCFPVYLSQVWTPCMNCSGPSQMVVAETFEHSC